jgi:hypothetical protein
MSLPRQNPYRVPRQKERLASSKVLGRASWGKFNRATHYFIFTSFVCSAVTKPAVGVFDLASNLSEGMSYPVRRTRLAYRRSGIRNTTTVFDKPERDRVRLVSDYSNPHGPPLTLPCLQPRHVPPDGILVVSSLWGVAFHSLDIHLLAILHS